MPADATPEDAILFDHAGLRRFATQAFQRLGLSETDAALVADSLVSADLRGVSTHGLVRLGVYLNNLRSGRVNARGRPRIVAEGPSTLAMDADGAMGQVAAYVAMQAVLERTKETGVVIATISNSTHFGAAAYYAMQALERGYIGLAMTNGAPAMAPWGGVGALLGNNPFAAAVPAGDEPPLVLDMAQTVVARGWIKLAAMRGEQLPPGWAFDADGRPTVDPQAALAGSLAPIGGYKGYGLATIIEALAGALAGALMGPEVENMGFTAAGDHSVQPQSPSPGPSRGVGHLVGAIDPSRFMDPRLFRSRVDWLIRTLRSAPRAKGVEQVYVPGELEYLREQRRRTDGVPLPADLVRELEAIAAELAISPPQPRAVAK